jgi:hypothetical protein
MRGTTVANSRSGVVSSGGLVAGQKLDLYTAQLYLRTLLNLFLSPLPRGAPGEGPDLPFS